jgi:drug/metabolite transporter (DMT)-like permease
MLRAKNGKSIVGTLQILAAFILAGTSVPVGKFLIGGLPPFTLALASLLCAFVFLLPSLLADRRALAAARGRDIFLVCVQALFGMALFRIFMLSGLSLTSGSHAGVITAFGPLIMGAASIVFLRERPRAAVLLGLILGTAGIMLLRLAEAGGEPRAASLWGDLLVLGAVSCEAAMSLIRKRSGVPFKPLTTAGIIVAASIVFVLPLAAGEWIGTGLPRFDLRDCMGILYYGAVATALAYYFWAAGSSKVSGNGIALAMVAMPLTAVAISVSLLGERLEPLVLAGLALGVAGMVIGQAKQPLSMMKENDRQ